MIAGLGVLFLGAYGPVILLLAVGYGVAAWRRAILAERSKREQTLLADRQRRHRAYQRKFADPYYAV